MSAALVNEFLTAHAQAAKWGDYTAAERAEVLAALRTRQETAAKDAERARRVAAGKWKYARGELEISAECRSRGMGRRWFKADAERYDRDARRLQREADGLAALIAFASFTDGTPAR